MKQIIWFLVVYVSISPAWSTTIDTVPYWDGSSVLGAQFGETSAPASQDTYGQVFVPPLGETHIVSFALYLSDSPIFQPDPVDFAAYVMKWDGFRPTGSILYQSAPTDTSGLAHAELRQFSFDIGLDLSQEQEYVFFISASDFFDGVTSGAFVGAMPSDTYLDGAIVQADSNGSFSDLLNTTPWYTSALGWDLAFTAEFSRAAVPEPHSIHLFAGGLVIFILQMIRRRAAS